LRSAAVLTPLPTIVMTGRLYLVPNLLGIVPPERVLPARTITVARGLANFIVENAKPARHFLKTAQRCEALLAPARAGHDMGLVSDAGCPGVADPGAGVVAAAHRLGITVVPLVGPSSLLLALMASGMNGQGFTFHGYLPVKADARIEAIRRLESESAGGRHAQLFIETPYRNATLLGALVATLRPETRLCVAADLTLDTETVESRPVRDWRGRDVSRYAKRPAIFIVQA
jgi:16S rRNA (cytidine1402-2'-O)-methyltransferase